MAMGIFDSVVVETDVTQADDVSSSLLCLGDFQILAGPAGKEKGTDC